jgi:hypothetical protein
MANNTLVTQSKSPVLASGGFVLFRVEPEEKGNHPLPIGMPDCLRNLEFCVSGVQRSLYDEEVIDLIRKYGGRVTSAVSSKTSYLVLGKDPGKLKSEAAVKHGTKIIDEKGLFDLISDSCKKRDDALLAMALNQELPTEGNSWKKMTSHVLKTLCKDKSSRQYKDAETYKPKNLEAIELLDFALKHIRDIWCERGKQVLINCGHFTFTDDEQEEESGNTNLVFSDETELKEWVIKNHEMTDIFSEAQIIQEYKKIKDRKKEEQIRIDMEIQTKEEELAALKTKRSQI